MSEPDATATATSEASEAAPTAFGARLAWERARAGLSINDIAARLRLHPGQIEALEREELSKLPVEAYVRGFIRGYARIVRVEPEALLGDYSARYGAGAAAAVGAQVAAAPMAAATETHGWRKLVIAGALLLLVALAVLGWRGQLAQVAGVAKPAPAAAPVAATAVVPAAPQPEPTAVSAPSPAPAASDNAAAATTEPAVTPTTAASPGEPGTLLKLSFDGSCWVQVTAADGRVLVSEEAVAGVERRINAPPPLTVVLGDAQNARVQVRGRDFELAPHTRQNVARFTLN